MVCARWDWGMGAHPQWELGSSELTLVCLSVFLFLSDTSCLEGGPTLGRGGGTP